MKNRTTTLLAATLVTLLVSSQSAMALNEESSGYSEILGNQVTSPYAMPAAAFMDNELIIGNSENGIDPAYVGYARVNTVIYDNQLNGKETNFLSGESSTR